MDFDGQKVLSLLRGRLNELAINLSSLDSVRESTAVFEISKNLAKIAEQNYLGPDYYLGPLHNNLEEIANTINNATFPGTAELTSHQDTPGLRIYHPSHLELFLTSAFGEKKEDQPSKMILFSLDEDKKLSLKDSSGTMLKGIPLELDAMEKAVESRLPTLWGELLKQKPITPSKIQDQSKE